MTKQINMERVREYVAIDKEIGELEDRVKLRKKDKRDLEQLLLDDFEKNEMQSVKLENRLAYLKVSTFARVDPDIGNEVLVAALKDHGLEDLVKPPVVNPQTLSAYVRELESTETPIPDEIAAAIIVQKVPSINIRKN